jgi:hypothetical protein
MLKFIVGGAFVAFVASGPLQHVGALPETAVGDLSKQAIKRVLGLGVKDAYAKCGSGFKPKGNNGWGNGEHLAPGNSLSRQPKFEDPNTGPSPSRSPRSGGGNR